MTINVLPYMNKSHTINDEWLLMNREIGVSQTISAIYLYGSPNWV
jgi:hypothetical protein